MMLRLLIIFLLFSFLPANAAVKITSGEHATFSRLVFPASEDVTYKVISGSREITVTLEGFAQDFDLSEIFDRIPKTRLVSVKQSQGTDTAKLTLSLGCNCLGLAYRLNQYLVIDIIGEDDTRFAVLDNTQDELAKTDIASDLSATSPPRKRPNSREQSPRPRLLRRPNEPELDPRANLYQPSERNVKDAATKLAEEAENARNSLLRQLQAAANDGLIELSEDVRQPEEPIADEAVSTDDQLKADVDAILSQADVLGSIRIRPVDEEPDIAALEEEIEPVKTCIPESRLDPENWADDRDFNAQLALLREPLLGEFDQPGADALSNLIKFYLHYGFGAEAKQLLKTYPNGFPDRAILEQIATIINGESSSSEDFFGTPNCDGRAGLWRALNGNDDAILGADGEKTILAAYGELPTLMRDQLAKRFIGGLIENNRVELAEKLLDINNRSPNIKESEIKLLKAKLLLKENRADEAESILTSLVAQNASNYQEALIELGREFIKRGGGLPVGFKQDLENASMENRDTELGRELFKTLVLANIAAGEPIEAFDILERDRDEILVTDEDRVDIVNAALKALLDSEAKPADVARIAIGSAQMIKSPSVQSELKSGLAARLVGDGLSNIALELLEDIPRSDQSRLTASKALIATGLVEDARQELGILDSQEARIMRARLKSREGDYQAAREELGQADDPNFFANLGWLQSEPSVNDQNQDKKNQGRVAASVFLNEITDDKSLGETEKISESEVTLEVTRSVLDAATKAREAAEILVEDP